MPRICAVAVLAPALVLTACGAGWRRLDDPTPRALPVRAQVQLWTEGRSWILHAVTLGPDSVSGVPFLRPPECDSCRVVIARSALDSMRLGNQERGVLRSAGLAFVIMGAGAVVLYFSVDTD